MSKEKIYVAYAKESDHYYLYAYSTIKEYFKNFIDSRAKNYFKVKIHEVDEDELHSFMNKNHSCQIIKDVLYDGKDDISIYCTVDESNKLSESCDWMIRTIKFMENNAHNIFYDESLSNDELDSIINLTNTISKCIGIGTNVANINTLKVFYQLFKSTFEFSKE